MSSRGSLGSRRASGFDRWRQKRRNPARCHLNTVSGLTSSKASRQRGTKHARSTSKPRSCGWNAGLFTFRDAMMSCWRSRAFSAMSSRRVRRRSPATPVTNGNGLVSRLNVAFSRAAARRATVRSRALTAAVMVTTSPEPAERTSPVLGRKLADPTADAKCSQYTGSLAAGSDTTTALATGSQQPRKDCSGHVQALPALYPAHASLPALASARAGSCRDGTLPLSGGGSRRFRSSHCSSPSSSSSACCSLSCS